MRTDLKYLIENIVKSYLKENDYEHQQELEKTGFWGKRGAGCLFYAKDTGKYLIGYRSDMVREPHTWGTWGGAIDSSESPEEGVKREIKEELSYKGFYELKYLWTYKHPSGYKYYNFLAIVDKQFDPILNWENSKYIWTDIDNIPKPIHFGLEALIKNYDFLKEF